MNAAINDDERTNSMGLFNTAEAWRLSAVALQSAKAASGHAEQLVRYLSFHALELYLKALLRQINALERKFRHDMNRIVQEAQALGLVIENQDAALLLLMGDTNVVIESRYIKTGSKTLPTLEALERTSKHIRDRVGELLRKRGVPVRL
jgi:HEPN domain-containing protein